MGEIVDGALRQQRISVVLIAGFSLGALLAAMGPFPLVSLPARRAVAIEPVRSLRDE